MCGKRGMGATGGASGRRPVGPHTRQPARRGGKPMNTTVFLIIFIALGFAVLAYFGRRSKNYSKRHPGEKNPIDFWLYGKDRKDDDES